MAPGHTVPGVTQTHRKFLAINVGVFGVKIEWVFGSTFGAILSMGGKTIHRYFYVKN